MLALFYVFIVIYFHCNSENEHLFEESCSIKPNINMEIPNKFVYRSVLYMPCSKYFFMAVHKKMYPTRELEIARAQDRKKK